MIYDIGYLNRPIIRRTWWYQDVYLTMIAMLLRLDLFLIDNVADLHRYTGDVI